MGDDGKGFDVQREALGAFIRARRRVADLSLRQLGDLTNVSNAYLSQVERGIHAPSMRVLRSIAEALEVSTEALLAQAGMSSDPDPAGDHPVPGEPGATAAAIAADPLLTEDQRRALLTVYASYVDASGRS